MLVVAPEPVSWEMWCAAAGNHQTVHLASMRAVDERASPVDSLAQPAKKPSAGDDVAAFSSSSGFRRELLPMWSPFGVGPSVAGQVSEEEYGQILQLRDVAAHKLVPFSKCCGWPCAKTFEARAPLSGGLGFRPF